MCLGSKEEDSLPRELSRFVCCMQHVEGLAIPGSSRTQILSIFLFHHPYHIGLRPHACPPTLSHGWLLHIQSHIHILGREEGEWLKTKGDKGFLLVSLCLLFRKISLPRDFLQHHPGQNMAPSW